ncbi:MAG TPA: OsmC family protein [Gaiellaceae bacterium]|jgi:osmotically inducible protein OsmC
MPELPFEVELEWSGEAGTGLIVTDDLELPYSVPASMGGRGTGSNPEELLVSAVGACYSATLQGQLRRAGLPASGVRVTARGAVEDYPHRARFARLTVSPTILGAEPSREADYAEAARAAHARCFIGRTIAGTVDYRLGTVTVEPARVAA